MEDAIVSDNTPETKEDIITDTPLIQVPLDTVPVNAEVSPDIETYYKHDDGKLIEVKREISLSTRTYDIEFLKNQRNMIIAQKDADNAQRDKEIAEVDALLEQASSLGII